MAKRRLDNDGVTVDTSVVADLSNIMLDGNEVVGMVKGEFIRERNVSQGCFGGKVKECG